jgi:hypothetical protein
MAVAQCPPANPSPERRIDASTVVCAKMPAQAYDFARFAAQLVPAFA